MAKQTINYGTNPNDGTGDNLRTAFSKSVLNFTELYNYSNITPQPVIRYSTQSYNAITSSITTGSIVMWVDSSSKVHVTNDTLTDMILVDMSDAYRSLYQGLTWDQDNDIYYRSGSIYNRPLGVSPGNSYLPIHRNMRGCVLTTAGTVSYYLDENNWNKKFDGTPSVLTGADGQVMVEIPKTYYKYSFSGSYHTWLISELKLPGFTVHPAFIKNNVEVDYRYMSAYEAVLYDVSAGRYANSIAQLAFTCSFKQSDSSISTTQYTAPFLNLEAGDKIVVGGTVRNNGTFTVVTVTSQSITTSESLLDEANITTTTIDSEFTTGTDWIGSVSGKNPLTNKTRPQFRVAAGKLGVGWRVNDYDLIHLIELLSIIEYGSFNLQQKIGSGVTNVTDWSTYNNYNPFVKTGMGNLYGNTTKNTAGSTSCTNEKLNFIKYRGIEQFWGHVYKWVDGINIYNNHPYISNNNTIFADDTSSSYFDPSMSLSSTDGYQNTLVSSSRLFFPATVGASSATKITDYYYQNSGWRAARFGGCALNGVLAGGFFWALANAAGDADQGIGARSSF